MIVNIEALVLAVALSIHSYWDLRYRRIPIVVTVIAGGIGLLCRMIAGAELTEILWGLLPGVICLGIGRITREAIGYGDGFLLCAMGMILPVDQVLSVGLIAVCLAGLCGLFLLVIGRKGRKDTLPFVPFLLVAYFLHCVGYMCAG